MSLMKAWASEMWGRLSGDDGPNSLRVMFVCVRVFGPHINGLIGSLLSMLDAVRAKSGQFTREAVFEQFL